MDEVPDGKTDRWTDEVPDGGMDRWLDGRTDERTDEVAGAGVPLTLPHTFSIMKEAGSCCSNTAQVM